MVRAEPTNNRTAGINTNHSTMFTLLLELLLNVICEQRWIQFELQNRSSRVFALMAKYTRDDHYPVCRLDIWRDSEFATGYGYPKTAFKREPDTDPDIRNAFIDISRIQTFGKSCTLHNH